MLGSARPTDITDKTDKGALQITPAFENRSPPFWGPPLLTFWKGVEAGVGTLELDSQHEEKEEKEEKKKERNMREERKEERNQKEGENTR